MRNRAGMKRKRREKHLGQEKHRVVQSTAVQRLAKVKLYQVLTRSRRSSEAVRMSQARK